MAETIFKPHGPLAPHDNDLFVGRMHELEQVERSIRAPSTDAYLAILGPRQIGKTSLLHRAQATITDSWRIAVVDFQTIPLATQVECYTFIYNSIFEQIRDTLPFFARLRRRRRVSSHPELCESLRLLSISSSSRKIAVLMDEIGVLGGETAIALCRTVRYIFTNRHRVEGFGKYLFIFAGAWELYEFSRGGSDEVSPLSNVVAFVHLSDLSSDEVREFLERNLGRLGRRFDPTIPAIIHEVTQGHPYLLQKIGAYIEKHSGQNSTSTITSGMVEDAVEKMLTRDQHLSNLVDLLMEGENRSELIELSNIILGKQVQFNRTIPLIVRLELMGLVRANDQGFCACRNPIYTRMVLENKAIGQILYGSEDYASSLKLDGFLTQVDPRFTQMRHSAWDTLRSVNPERGRMAAHEMRELLSQLLHSLAPVEDVLAQPEYCNLQTGQITRKTRVRFALGGKEASRTDIGIIDSLARLADDMYGALSGRAHLDNEVGIEVVASYMRTAERVMISILERSIRKLKC